MTRDQVAILRRQFIKDREKVLKKRVSSAENKLYDSVFSKMISEMEVTGGRITSNGKNIDMANALDKIFRDFNKNEYFKVFQHFAKDLNDLQGLNNTYFSIVADDQKQFNTAKREVNSIMKKRIGITTEGGVKSGGYLDRLITDKTLSDKVKKATYRSVTSGVSLLDFTSRIKKLIVGSEKVNGGLQKHFSTFAYDTYAQYDRANQRLFAVKLDLKAFIYAGGLIQSSRKFCIKRNGQVYTTDEAQKWKNDPDLIKVDGETYDPLIDCGGPNCRHSPNFISRSSAIRMRPDLEGKL